MICWTSVTIGSMRTFYVQFYDDLFEIRLPASDVNLNALERALRRQRPVICNLLSSGASLQFGSVDDDAMLVALGHDAVVNVTVRHDTAKVVNDMIAQFRREGPEQIEWDDETQSHGRATYPSGSMGVVSKNLGIARFAKSCLIYTIRDLYEALHLQEPVRSIQLLAPLFHGGHSAFYSLRAIRPQQRMTDEFDLEHFTALVVSTVQAALESVEVARDAPKVREAAAEQCDALFLAMLARRGRNYKEGCAICLADQIMGTTCTCGHTEIAVFRPCGHSVCATPCFRDAFGEAEVKTQTAANGKTYRVHTQRDVRDVKNFACHMCRSNVDRVFRAENISLQPAFANILNVAPLEAYLASHLQNN